jgi:trehalose 6-phosphate synthase/phosphatase
MAKTIIISNRLPVKIITENDQLTLQVSEGGLATGLGSIYKQDGNIWIGWPGIELDQETQQKEAKVLLAEQNLVPVFLSEQEIQKYYEGFSNEILWPVFHYMPTYAQFDNEYWAFYKSVHDKFKDTILEWIEPGDIVWIHDYQLLLLAQLIRNEIPDASIGFFQHIPFPSFEIFRLIPWRSEIIAGMLGADLIINSATHLQTISGQANKIINNGREILVDAFPMGIDAKKFQNLTKRPEVQTELNHFNELYGKHKIILSIDRLDYSKGILQRLRAFELILEKHPEYIDKVILFMIVVPSRDTITQYKELKNEIDKLVGNINAKFRSTTWNPIQYFYRSFPIETLSVLYTRADICLVTPMRDGMNLVSKEYVASRSQQDGVLILSEMAGASKELTESLIVNPNNLEEVYKTILKALDMSPEEQTSRMKPLWDTVNKFDIHHWVNIFMKDLQLVKARQSLIEAKKINSKNIERILSQYVSSEKRVFFLDYDGTLVGFNNDIDLAYPDSSLYELVEKLVLNPNNKVVIISGRKHETLEKWFGAFRVDLIAEHGAWKKINNKDWEVIPELKADWKDSIKSMMEAYSDRTPGSFIEDKSYSLAWHYRTADHDLGEVRAGELITNLTYLTREIGLQILQGDKVLEIRNAEVNKGKAALEYIGQNPSDFIIAIGDDHTDEDIFTQLPESAITIKVGSKLSAAQYFLRNVNEVRIFLKRFVDPTS